MSAQELFKAVLSVVHEQQGVTDDVWIVDRQTGCMFVGERLVHSDECRCDEDDRQEV